MHPLEAYYARQPEPAQGCLLALRAHIHAQAGPGEITEVWSYYMPTFRYRGKRFCYLWTQKSDGMPYIGFINGTHVADEALRVEGRKRMKILVLDPSADLPVALLDKVLQQALAGVA